MAFFDFLFQLFCYHFNMHMFLICASFIFFLFFLFFIALLNKLIDRQDDLPNLLPPLKLRILLQIKIYQLQPHMQRILRPQNQFSLLISHPHQLWLRIIDIFPHLNQSLSHRAFKFTQILKRHINYRRRSHRNFFFNMIDKIIHIL